MNFKKFISREVVEAFEWTDDVEPDGHVIRYATKENVDAYNIGEDSDIHTSMISYKEDDIEIKVPYIIYNGVKVLGGNGNVMVKTNDGKQLYAMPIDSFKQKYRPVDDDL
jgi:hypothetical protein